MATKKSILDRLGEIIILVFAIVCIALVAAHFYTTFSESYKTEKTSVDWAIGSEEKESTMSPELPLEELIERFRRGD